MIFYSDIGLQTLDGSTRPPGIPLTGQWHFTKLVTEYDSTAYATASALTIVDMKTWTNQTGFKAGSKLELYYHVPCRNDSASWGGGYIEPNISFDGGTTWYSLGHCGYDGGVMNVTNYEIHNYNNIIWIDPNQASAYQVRLKFRFCSYDGTLLVNSGNVINNGWTGYNSNFLTVNNCCYQHYMHYILKEWTPVA